MRKRIPYLISFAVLLGIEIVIGLRIHDAFIRPYVGDVLVAALLCCLGRVFFPDRFPWLPAGVFGLAVLVECVQLIELPALEGTLVGIILGSTFDPADIVCYLVGCALFEAACRICKRIVR